MPPVDTINITCSLYLLNTEMKWYFSKRTTYLTRIFTGVITLARFPTGRAVIMCVKWEAKVLDLGLSLFVWWEDILNAIKYVLKSLNRGKLKTRKYKEKYLSCQN